MVPCPALFRTKIKQSTYNIVCIFLQCSTFYAVLKPAIYIILNKEKKHGGLDDNETNKGKSTTWNWNCIDHYILKLTEVSNSCQCPRVQSAGDTEAQFILTSQTLLFFEKEN